MTSKLANFANGIGCCESQEQGECAPAPVIPFTVRCCVEQDTKENGDSPGKRLINVDAMEEMCFYPKDENEFDCFNVCDCCGVITKYCSGNENDNGCKPVKYARRQRFTFKDEKTGCIPPQPPWPFKYEALCCPPPCCPADTTCCCKEGCCVAMGKNVDGLPCQSGVYYYNKTENKLVLQTRNVTKDTPPSTRQNCCEGSNVQEEDEECPKPCVIQPLLMPNGGKPCGGGGCCAPPPCNPCCPQPCCAPCCPQPCCPPPCGPCGPCGPCCPPCGPCCPPPFCGPCCPPPWCCNPWCCPPMGACCMFPPYGTPCCGPPPCCPCPPTCNPCCQPPPPPPPPPPPAQTTVIPMCIPINPPVVPKCNGCAGPACPKYDETVIELQKGCKGRRC